jgi:acetyl-CoA carboxylase biotin carboxyl carrier protein
MNKKTIESYIELFKASGLGSLSIKTAEFEISMGVSPSSSGVSKNPVIVETTPPPKPSSQDIVKAPIVGIFYASPGPGEPPFVRTGQKIKKGDPIGIIEAMKVMNEIVATKEGRVQAIFVKDKDYVEYDQPLIEIV